MIRSYLVQSCSFSPSPLPTRVPNTKFGTPIPKEKLKCELRRRKLHHHLPYHDARPMTLPPCQTMPLPTEPQREGSTFSFQKNFRCDEAERLLDKFPIHFMFTKPLCSPIQQNRHTGPRWNTKFETPSPSFFKGWAERPESVSSHKPVTHIFPTGGGGSVWCRKKTTPRRWGRRHIKK